jgi:thiamine-phosphate pyrophosphorylase
MAVVSTAAGGLRAEPRATLIQLRAPGLEARELEREARTLVARSRLPVLVSSRCDVALSVGAAGVNLPERDIAVADARRLVGSRLVGESVHTVESALRAEREGADFVIFGPVYATASHRHAPPAGVEGLALVCAAVRIPVIAIGGIDERRAAECIATGAAGYAAITLFR